ncbi:MAG: hypothetical protein ABJD68_02315 [Nakamurella sp.]
MTASVPTDRQVTGGDLRRRVRRITAGCVALAAIASTALTVNFAWASNDQQQGSANSSTADETTATSGATTKAAAPSTKAPTEPPHAVAPDVPAPAPIITPAPSTRTLATPQQAPTASKGRSHATSGGS